jgi:protein TonB
MNHPSICVLASLLLAACASPKQAPYSPPKDGDIVTLKPHSVDKVDKSPVVLVLPDPGYPDLLRAKGIRGSAVISFVVGLDGRAAEIVVKESSHPEAGEAARQAVARALFKPALRDGTPVAAKMEMSLNIPMR